MKLADSSIFRYNTKRIFWIAALFAAAASAVTLLRDAVEAGVKQQAWYFSESFLFSSFWWLLVPFMYLQYLFANSKKGPKGGRIVVSFIIPALLHLLAYPALVYIFSAVFYYHTFAYRQTLFFCLHQYLPALLFFYSVPAGAYIFYRSRQQKAAVSSAPDGQPCSLPAFITITGGTRRFNVELASILYITTSKPYISIHAGGRRYLHNDTLKGIAARLDPAVFIQVHRSAIVNVEQVEAYTSRLNGDYDLTMRNGDTVRLSRNYAAAFRAAFGHAPQPGI